MNNIIEEMLNKYHATTIDEKKNALKEIIQEIVLCGLSRANFFDKAAFYGGTALRIYYGLDRFSEDLDFSLKQKDPNFDLTVYFPILEKEIRSFGFEMKIEMEEKNSESPIKSAFLKGDTKEHLLIFYPKENYSTGIPNGELLKIKLEVDTNPPALASYEHRFSLRPEPYEVTIYDLSSLFAGKIHAILCRNWNNRIKGRDLYDYIFYLQKGANVNLSHLKERLVQSNAFNKNEELTIDKLKALLTKRFDSIDYKQAKEDVANFIKDKKVLDIWSAAFFKSITQNLK